jgi:sRNA-binding carbon storage regulator CsrA
MLVFTRKSHESVVIGRREDLEPTVVVTVLEITAGRVRLGFQSDMGGNPPSRGVGTHPEW